MEAVLLRMKRWGRVFLSWVYRVSLYHWLKTHPADAGAIAIFLGVFLSAGSYFGTHTSGPGKAQAAPPGVASIAKPSDQNPPTPSDSQGAGSAVPKKQGVASGDVDAGTPDRGPPPSFTTAPATGVEPKEQTASSHADLGSTAPVGSPSAEMAMAAAANVPLSDPMPKRVADLACSATYGASDGQLVIAERSGSELDGQVAKDLCDSIGARLPAGGGSGPMVRTTIEIIDVKLTKATPNFGAGIVWQSSASIRLRLKRGVAPEAVFDRSFEGTGKMSAADAANGASALVMAENDAINDAVVHASDFITSP